MINRRDYKNKAFVCKRIGKTEGKKYLSNMTSSKTLEQKER